MVVSVERFVLTATGNADFVLSLQLIQLCLVLDNFKTLGFSGFILLPTALDGTGFFTNMQLKICRNSLSIQSVSFSLRFFFCDLTSFSMCSNVFITLLHVMNTLSSSVAQHLFALYSFSHLNLITIFCFPLSPSLQRYLGKFLVRVSLYLVYFDSSISGSNSCYCGSLSLLTTCSTARKFLSSYLNFFQRVSIFS